MAVGQRIEILDTGDFGSAILGRFQILKFGVDFNALKKAGMRCGCLCGVCCFSLVGQGLPNEDTLFLFPVLCLLGLS